MKGTYLGEFEELVLLMVIIVQEDAYVFKLREQLQEEAGRTTSMGALHSTLARLEKKGFLDSEMKGATQARGGRRKRVYKLTTAGKAALSRARELRENLWSKVPAFALDINYG